MSGHPGDDDGGRRSPDPDGLPGFPPEWGRIVIPDDPAELDHEAAKVRRELRRESLLRRHGLRARPRMQRLMLPLVLLTMAVLVATTSLFAALFPQGRRAGGSGSPSSKATAAQTGAPLPDLTLTGADGRTVALRSAHPAVVLVLRHCGCRSLIHGTAKAAGGDVQVLVVGATSPPALPTLPAGSRVTALADHAGQLTEAVAAGQQEQKLAAKTASALLVDQDGTLIATVPVTTDSTDFAERVPALAG